MEHITNVLVYSNRCEVLDSHIFTVDDRGFPHIKLKFIYMFGTETLQGKQLELKYILPDRRYYKENIIVTGKNEVIFPIYYGVFINGGWTTLKISILEGANRIALDDIIIKTKKLEVGEEFKNSRVEKLVQAEVVAKTKEIKEESERQKKEIKELIKATKERSISEIEDSTRNKMSEFTEELKKKVNELDVLLKNAQTDIKNSINGLNKNEKEAIKEFEKVLSEKIGSLKTLSDELKNDLSNVVSKYVVDNRDKLKGDRGPGITSISAIRDKITINYDDNKTAVFTVPTVAGRDGREIQSLIYSNNVLRLIMNDNSVKEVAIRPTQNNNLKIKKVFDGSAPLNINVICNLPDGWKFCFIKFKVSYGQINTQMFFNDNKGSYEVFTGFADVPQILKIDNSKGKNSMYFDFGNDNYNANNMNYNLNISEVIVLFEE